ncbi:MAG: hypothetical protein CHACPFDD_04049 [Phycisphaerae bacterium]|nr:hypothetical protein [Phycisphaerae bacterium]
MPPPYGPRLASGVRMKRPSSVGASTERGRVHRTSARPPNVAASTERRRIRTPHASEGSEARQACCVRMSPGRGGAPAVRPPTCVGGSDEAPVERRRVHRTWARPPNVGASTERRRIRTPLASEGSEARQACCVRMSPGRGGAPAVRPPTCVGGSDEVAVERRRVHRTSAHPRNVAASEPLTPVRGRRRDRRVASGCRQGAAVPSPYGPRLASGVRISPTCVGGSDFRDVRRGGRVANPAPH